MIGMKEIIVLLVVLAGGYYLGVKYPALASKVPGL